MKERLYIAFWDDGHDFGEFKFYSKHRANSKPNMGDAYCEAVLKYGINRANEIKITGTSLY